MSQRCQNVSPILYYCMLYQLLLCIWYAYVTITIIYFQYRKLISTARCRCMTVLHLYKLYIIRIIDWSKTPEQFIVEGYQEYMKMQSPWYVGFSSTRQKKKWYQENWSLLVFYLFLWYNQFKIKETLVQIYIKKTQTRKFM